MIIRRLWWQAYRVPYGAMLTTANAAEPARDGIILGIETDGGITGIGEASPLRSYAGGTIKETGEAIGEVAIALAGRPVQEIWDGTVAYPVVSSGAMAAVHCGLETAAASLLATEAGLPLSHWYAARIGLDAGSVLARVPVNGIIDSIEPAQAAKEARMMAAKGIRTIKVKVGSDHDADAKRVAAVRAAAGVGVSIRIDPNGSWTYAESPDLLKRYAAIGGVSLCEQPISHKLATAVAKLALLKAQSPAAIAADESCRSLADLRLLIDQSAVGAVVIKPMICGLRESLAMVALAREHQMPVIVTTAFESGIGTAAAIHLGALLGRGAMACGLATLDRLVDDLIVHAPVIEHGYIGVPSGTGLGVGLDNAALGRYATGPRRSVPA